MTAGHRFDNALRRRDADHPDQTQLTPTYALEPIRADLGGIGLDPCTIRSNPVGADYFYTVAEDGLARDWQDPYLGWLPSVFVNPPYGEAREPWVERCMEAGKHQRVVLLIPAATDTRIFQRAAETADAIVFVRGRLKFGTLRPNRRLVATRSVFQPRIAEGCEAACCRLGLRMVGGDASGSLDTPCPGDTKKETPGLSAPMNERNPE